MIHASKKNQHGAVLLMALMFLILLTLIGIAAVNSTSSGFKVVGNMQSRAYALSVAQAAIESVISSTTAFYAPATSTVMVDGQIVAVSVPVCTGTSPAAGYELGQSSVTPVDNHWAVGATYTDTITSASVAVRQGVKMRQTQGSC